MRTLRAEISQAFLVALCCVVTAAAWGEEGASGAHGQVNLPEARTKGDRRPITGAYYYPWYGVNDRPLDHDWHHLLRLKLTPPQLPLAGLYRSDDPQTVAEQIAQSRRAGLSFWACSWWGPHSATDRTIREAILKHPEADALRFAVLYESTGRLGSMDRPRYGALLSDFAYLSDNYFQDSRYLKIDGRPVVFIYLSRVYFRQRGLEELAALRKKFPEVYLVGDDVFGQHYESAWADRFDAVTAYDVYGQSVKLHRATMASVTALAANYSHARAKANEVETAFIPAVAPGYNDRAVRKGNPGTPRHLIDTAKPDEGDLFRAMLRKAAIPNLDDRCGRLLLVTSFNEWYEDTQIEATLGTGPAASRDSSDSGTDYTDGHQYVDYGALYLDILRAETQRPLQND